MHVISLQQAQLAYDRRLPPDYDRDADLYDQVSASLGTSDLFGWMNEQETASVAEALDALSDALSGLRFTNDLKRIAEAAERLEAEFEAIRDRATCELVTNRLAEAAEQAKETEMERRERRTERAW